MVDFATLQFLAYFFCIFAKKNLCQRLLDKNILTLKWTVCFSSDSCSADRWTTHIYDMFRVIHAASQYCDWNVSNGAQRYGWSWLWYTLRMVRGRHEHDFGCIFLWIVLYDVSSWFPCRMVWRNIHHSYRFDREHCDDSIDAVHVRLVDLGHLCEPLRSRSGWCMFLSFLQTNDEL